MTTQTKVWNADLGNVTRIAAAGSPKEGCGNSKRLYVGRIGGYNYNSWLRFNLDWTNVGKVLKAYLVVYTDDFLGLSDQPESGDTPAIRIRRLDAAFGEGTTPNSDGNFGTSDYRPGSTTSSGEVRTVMTEEANGLNRIDITGIVNAWAPSGVKRSNNTTGAPAKNYGIGLIQYGSLNDTAREWSGWSEDASDAGMRPTIELVYEYGATTPDTPGTLTPSGSVVSIGSFTGTFSDPRTTDKLAKSHVQVYSPGKTVTSISTADLVTTSTAHGFKAGNAVYFTALTGGTGLTTFTRYYVIASGLTTTAFKVSATSGGAAVNVTVAATAGTVRTLLYDKVQLESNAAIVAGVFDHVPSDLHLVKGQTYAWRVRVYDQEGQVSAWTSLTSVSVSNTDPTAPTLTPTAKTYSTLDGIQFKGGTFSDPDAGDRLLAYQVQLSAYAQGAPEWDDPTFLKWDTGKRLVSYGATSWSTPYGGTSLDAGTYYWRARQWDNHGGLSSWSYGSVILSANFEGDPELSVNAIQLRPRAPWRILIKEMKFNAVGGNITGVAATNVLTSATAHGLRPGRKVRFTALTGGTGLLKGVDYYVRGVTTTTFTLAETYGGAELDFTTDVTAGTLTAVTTRGPGNVVAVLEDAKNVGASLLYNSPGEAHWTLSKSHPQLSVIEPRQVHYAIEFRQGDGWREVFAGLVVDFDASDDDIVFYGIDYLGLLDFVVDEHYKPENIDTTAEQGGSKYVNKTLTYIVTHQLTRSRENANSIVGFIGTGSIATMAEQVTVFSTYQSTLPFIASLLDSHRAGSGKRTRIYCAKTTAGAYEWRVTDDPGVTRDNLRLRYGELVQGYRVIPFGNQWASRVAAVGRDKNGVRVRYASASGPGIDENVWGHWVQPIFIDGVADANDLNRRVRQAALSASKLGKQVALALRSGVLQPRDGYELLDQFLVDIEDGSVSTSAFGSGYWVAAGITWQALEQGDLNTTLTLQPREDSTAPSADLLTLQEISEQPEWQIGWNPPAAVTTANGPSARYWFDNTSGTVYKRVGGTLRVTGATGTI